jgi:acyl carrier protein
MRSHEEQGQRWLVVAFVLVLGLQGFALAERLAGGSVRAIAPWLPFLGLQLGMMCATWLGHRWARWILCLLLVREVLLSFQLVLNFSNVGLVLAFSIYLVALRLLSLGNVGEFVRHQNRKHRMSTSTEAGQLPEKAAFWSLMGPAIAVVILLSSQPVPRNGYDAGAWLGLGAMAALLAGMASGIIGMFTASHGRRSGPLRTAIAGTCLCAILGGLWIWAAAGWPEQLERARMAAARTTKEYLPIQTTTLQLEVADRIKREVGRMMNRRPQEFDAHKPLLAQGLDDLQLVELVLSMERAFQVKVPDARISNKTGDGSSMLTIEQLANVITAEMKNKVSTAAYQPE